MKTPKTVPDQFSTLGMTATALEVAEIPTEIKPNESTPVFEQPAAT